MSRRRLSSKIRREQLVQAALEVLGKSGVRKLSVAAVARRVGLVPSALYRHFRSKEELLDAMPELIRERLLMNVQAAEAETDDAVGQLHRLLVRHVGIIRGDVGIPRMVFSEEFYSAHAERRKKVYEGIRAYLGAVAQMVRLGQKQGRIRRGLDAETAALMFLGIVQPAAILWHMSDGRFDANEHAGRAWKVFKRMLTEK